MYSYFQYAAVAALALYGASSTYAREDCTNGPPRAFSSCGSDALDGFSTEKPDAADAWAQGALKNFVDRRGLDCLSTSKVNDIVLSCRNSYEDRVWVLVLDADVPCYESDGPLYLQARIYDRDDGASSNDKDATYDCVDDICNDRDERYCDDDDDDGDDRR